MGFTNKLFTFTQVSEHDNAKDCWVIINAKAYDVTKFLEDHPGGDEILLRVAGEDATEEFEAAGHGSAARLMLDEYYVGEIDVASTVVVKAAKPIKVIRATPTPPRKNESSNLIIKLFVFLLVLGLALGIRLYASSL